MGRKEKMIRVHPDFYRRLIIKKFDYGCKNYYELTKYLVDIEDGVDELSKTKKQKKKKYSII